MDTQEKEYKVIAEKSEANDSQRQVEQASEQKQVVQDDEIDLLDLFKQIWQRKRVLFLTVGGALLIGIFIAAVSPEEYSAKIVLMPQSESGGGISNSGLLGQLSGIAGVNLSGGGGSGLSKNLYPDITQSTPFYLSLMKEDVYFSSLDSSITLYQYFSEVKQPPLTEKIKKYTFGLPRLIIRLPVQIAAFFSFSEKDTGSKSLNDKSVENLTSDTTQIVPKAVIGTYTPIELKRRQLSVMSSLKDRIITNIEPTGMVSVSAEMPDPVAAAKLTELAVEYLTNYIIEYRTDKVQEDHRFIEEQFAEKEQRYRQAQQRLAQLRDRNANIISETARIELEQAQTDYNLAFSLYQGVAQQLEQSKIKIQQETPVFKVLEPIQVPVSPSEPDRELIIILSLFAGVAVGLGIIVLQIVISNVRSKI